MEVQPFCENTIHRDGCCMAAPDFIPRHTDAWLNDDEKAIRQPTGSEMHLFLRRKVEELPLDELSKKRLLALLDDYLPLVDDEWWDDTAPDVDVDDDDDDDEPTI